MSSSTPSKSISTHLGTVYAGTGRNSGVPEQARDNETGEPLLIIHTTEAKLREAEAKILDIQNLNEVPTSLHKLGLAAFVFQIAQAIFLFILAARDKAEYYWFTDFPSAEDPKIPDPQLVTGFSILWYSPVFLCLSGFQHVITLIFRKQYEYGIARNRNIFRWTEYTFSASLMRVMIAQLAGVTDVHLLFASFVLSACTIQFGACHEVINAKARADGLHQYWRPFYAAWLSFAAGWLIIFNYAAVLGMDNNAKPGVVAIVLVMFFLDLSFAIVFCVQWSSWGPFHDYVLGEKVFIMLSFTSKTLLAWVAFGTV